MKGRMAVLSRTKLGIVSIEVIKNNIVIKLIKVLVAMVVVYCPLHTDHQSTLICG